MNSRTQQMALYDIPSLPESLQKLKYIQTDTTYNDPNSVSNFMMEAIRYTGTDAPLHEEDLPRNGRNPLSASILSMQEYGSRYKRDPYHPELFLGDLTNDPRLSTTEPLVAQMADQNRFRQQRYIHGKLQDVGDVRMEGMVGSKRMLKQIKDGYNITATRMGGVFDESTDGMVRKANPNPGKTIHSAEDTIQEDQTFYQQLDEKILPQYGTDIVSKLSNLIGVNWQTQPDQKTGLSSVSNVYRSKQDIDQSVNAVFRLGSQDTDFKQETTNTKNGTVVLQVESFKAARANAQSVNVSTNKDSVKNKFAAKMLHPPTPISQVDNFVATQAVPTQMETKALTQKFNASPNHVESLVEPLKGKSMKTITNTPSTIPLKDKLTVTRQVKKTQKNSSRNEDKHKHRKFSSKILSEAFKTKVDTKQEQGKTKDRKIVHYSNKVKENHIDHVSNVKMTKSKFSSIKEHATSNPTGSNTLPTAPSMNDFSYDTDPTMDNSYLTRTGVSQITATVSRPGEMDNNISPLTDMIAPIMTKYPSSS